MISPPGDRDPGGEMSFAMRNGFRRETGTNGNSRGRSESGNQELRTRGRGGSNLSDVAGESRGVAKGSPSSLRGERPRLQRKHLIRVDPCPSVVAPPRSDSGARSFVSLGVSSWLPGLFRVFRAFRGATFLLGDSYRDRITPFPSTPFRFPSSPPARRSRTGTLPVIRTGQAREDRLLPSPQLPIETGHFIGMLRGEVVSLRRVRP